MQGYALGAAPRAAASDPAAPAPFALLLIDNDGALRIDHAARPLLLRGLAPGPHTLRAVLSRPWGEVIKAKGAFAMTRFWVGARAADSAAAREAEERAWPDPKKPLLTYVFPLGELRGGLSLTPAPPLTASTPGADPSPDAGAQLSAQVSTDSGVILDAIDARSRASGDEIAPDPVNDRAPKPLPAQLALDFYLSGAFFKERGGAAKVRVVLNQRELPIVRAYGPLPLPLKPGKNRVTIDLLDRRSTKVPNALNRTDRMIAIP